ncbi:MAG: hypothetical protein AAGJ28_04065 [Pseudomonadota bacterium]
MTFRFFIVVTVALWATNAAAEETLTPERMRQMAQGSTLDAIEAAFDIHQDEFRNGEIGQRAYLAPYAAFKTTDPVMRAKVEAWLAASPKSPYAMTAWASAEGHLGYIYRGEDYVEDTPPAALAKASEKFGTAIRLYRAALDAEPSMLSAAYGLVGVAAFSGNHPQRTFALGIVDRRAERDQATLFGLKYKYPRWGGSWEKVDQFCRERTAEPQRLTYEQCMAVAAFDHGYVKEAWETLSQGPRDLFHRYGIHALINSDQFEAAREMAEKHGAMTLYFADRIYNRSGDASALKELVERNLRLDPLRPELLLAQSDLRWHGRDPDGARRALDKAMLYGLHDPAVRLQRLHRSLPEDRWDELLSSVEDTDYTMKVASYAVQLFEYSETPFASDVPSRSDFRCVRLTVLERHKALCASGHDDYRCQSRRRDTLIVQDKEDDVCAKGDGPSWQDRVRGLLKLDE